MRHLILAIEIDWSFTQKDGESFRRYEINETYADGQCIDIYETNKGSYIILFTDGRMYETFNPNMIYIVPLNHKLMKEHGII